MRNRFIGIDLTSPYVQGIPRPITLAEFVPNDLDGVGFAGSLSYLSDSIWPVNWPLTAAGLTAATLGPSNWPSLVADERLWLAIDGPLGLADQPGATLRQCEREAGTPGKTPYDYPDPTRPFAGYVTGSIVLWSFLTRFSGIQVRVDNGNHLLDEAAAAINYCEIFPGVTWRDLTPGRLLPNKDTGDGKSARIALLSALKVQVPQHLLTRRDAADVLDAGIGALVVYAWYRGKSLKYGKTPRWDKAAETWREGYIRSIRLNGPVDFSEVNAWIGRPRSKQPRTGVKSKRSTKKTPSGLTEFQFQVAEQVMKLVKGQVTTYGEIAEAIGNPRAAQAVGQAIAEASGNYRSHNEEFPDHRVLLTDFRLQKGYPGGLDEQKRKLEAEGVRFRQVQGGRWKVICYE